METPPDLSFFRQPGVTLKPGDRFTIAESYKRGWALRFWQWGLRREPPPLSVWCVTATNDMAMEE